MILKNTTLPKMDEKVKDLIASDARFTTKYKAKCVCISVGASHAIIRRDLKTRRISAIWISHLLTKSISFLE
jgi:hypothetical protein